MYVHVPMYLVHTYIPTGTCDQGRVPVAVGGKSNEAFCLTLPGNLLDVSKLLNKEKKFRHRGNKEGALQAMRNLQEDGLGNLEEKQAKGSVKVGMCMHIIMCILYFMCLCLSFYRPGCSERLPFQLTRIA